MSYELLAIVITIFILASMIAWGIYCEGRSCGRFQLGGKIFDRPLNSSKTRSEIGNADLPESEIVRE